MPRHTKKNNARKTRGGWKYNRKLSKNSRVLTKKSTKGGECGCNKFFKGGMGVAGANPMDAKGVIPLADVGGDPSRAQITEHTGIVQGGGGGKCKRCGKRRRTSRRYRRTKKGGFGNDIVSNSGLVPGMATSANSIFTGSALIRPEVYSQPNLKTSTLI